jgi:hypothetical protein
MISRGHVLGGCAGIPHDSRLELTPLYGKSEIVCQGAAVCDFDDCRLSTHKLIEPPIANRQISLGANDYAGSAVRDLGRRHGCRNMTDEWQPSRFGGVGNCKKTISCEAIVHLDEINVQFRQRIEGPSIFGRSLSWPRLFSSP